MSAEELPEPILAFIQQHLASVEELEILLVLHRHRPQSWTAAEIAAELRTGQQSAQQTLERWRERSFAVDDRDRYEFTPNESQIELVTAVAKEYQERRVRFIAAIYSKPAPGIKAFSNAFKLRKD